MKHLQGILAYIGIGALCHAYFIGERFDFTSAWTIGIMLGWPFYLAALAVGYVGMWVLWVFAIIIVICLLVGIYTHFQEKLERKNR